MRIDDEELKDSPRQTERQTNSTITRIKRKLSSAFTSITEIQNKSLSRMNKQIDKQFTKTLANQERLLRQMYEGMDDAALESATKLHETRLNNLEMLMDRWEDVHDSVNKDLNFTDKLMSEVFFYKRKYDLRNLEREFRTKLGQMDKESEEWTEKLSKRFTSLSEQLRDWSTAINVGDIEGQLGDATQSIRDSMRIMRNSGFSDIQSFVDNELGDIVRNQLNNQFSVGEVMTKAADLSEQGFNEDVLRRILANTVQAEAAGIDTGYMKEVYDQMKAQGYNNSQIADQLNLLNNNMYKLKSADHDISIGSLSEMMTQASEGSGYLSSAATKNDINEYLKRSAQMQAEAAAGSQIKGFSQVSELLNNIQNTNSYEALSQMLGGRGYDVKQLLNEGRRDEAVKFLMDYLQSLNLDTMSMEQRGSLLEQIGMSEEELGTLVTNLATRRQEFDQSYERFYDQIRNNKLSGEDLSKYDNMNSWFDQFTKDIVNSELGMTISNTLNDIDLSLTEFLLLTNTFKDLGFNVLGKIGKLKDTRIFRQATSGVKGLLKGGNLLKLGGAISALSVGYDMMQGSDMAQKWNVGTANAALSSAVGGTGSGIGNGVTKALEFGSIGMMLGGPLGAAIGAAVGGVFGTIGGENIAKFFSSMTDDATNWFNETTDSAYRLFTETIPNKISDSLTGFKDILTQGIFGEDNITKIKKDGLLSWIKSKVWDDEPDGSHRTGLNYVPRDNYLANLHQGEAVLTKTQADTMRQLGNNSVTNFFSNLLNSTNVSDQIASSVADGIAPMISGNNKQNAIATWKFLTKNMNFSKDNAAAIMGNLAQESQFNTGAISFDGNGSLGIAQWTFGRRQALESHAMALGKQATDLDAQLSYLRQELTGTEAESISALNRANNLYDKTVAFGRAFERPSEQYAMWNTRYGYAQNALKDFSKYEQGTPYVPDDQLAVLHEGEAVVPADNNPFDASGGVTNATPISNSKELEEIIKVLQWGFNKLDKSIKTLEEKGNPAPANNPFAKYIKPAQVPSVFSFS